MAWRRLTKQQWDAVRPHLPTSKPSGRGGRPRVEDRRCFEGILWILWTGAHWSALPRRSSSPSTCWRRLKHWEETGILRKWWRAFLAPLNDRENRRGDECFADGRCVPANRGDLKSARPSGARAQRGWWWAMARVLRWAHTGRRLPRRKLRSSNKRSTPSRAAAQASQDAPAHGPRV